MKYLISDPNTLVESELTLLASRLTESSLLMSKSDLSKMNGLFQMKYQNKFGSAPTYSHDVGNNFRITNLPDDATVRSEIQSFYKSYGIDTWFN